MATRESTKKELVTCLELYQTNNGGISMASKQCRCGSTEHEAVTSRGLAGMTTITMCPLELEAAREAMEKPVRMYSGSKIL